MWIITINSLLSTEDRERVGIIKICLINQVHKQAPSEHTHDTGHSTGRTETEGVFFLLIIGELFGLDENQ